MVYYTNNRGIYGATISDYAGSAQQLRNLKLNIYTIIYILFLYYILNSKLSRIKYQGPDLTVFAN